MNITMDDRCGGCQRMLVAYAGTMYECPNCSVMFCEECFQKLNTGKEWSCPVCGLPPKAALPRPQTFGR
jgi:predicted RNA-binding Zn-ribbon protein involved in translation (DUF1610 family)